MNVRPILFSAEMVRALLAGTKTQTRRAIDAPTVRGDYILSFNHGVAEFNFGPEDRKKNGDLKWHRCRYGKPDDLLWVRESHYIIGEHAGGWPGSRWTHYAADLSNNLGDTDHQWTQGWKPSIHMPRWASRLTLRITDVRVQRLQEISIADARAEGVVKTFDGHGWHVEDDTFRDSCPRDSYAQLWQAINGAGSWDANPWVWAISFDVVKANVDQVLAQAVQA